VILFAPHTRCCRADTAVQQLRKNYPFGPSFTDRVSAIERKLLRPALAERRYFVEFFLANRCLRSARRVGCNSVI